MKMSLVYKMSISALLIALTIIFTKLIPFVQNIPGLMFVRISLGPSIIIFSSLLLGPVYGGVVGVMSDVVGFLFDTSGYPFNPLFSITSMLLGVLPGLLVYFTKKYRYNHKFPIAITVLLSIVYVCVILLVTLNNSFTYNNYTFVLEPYVKILFIVLTPVLFALLILAIYWINRYFQKRITSYSSTPSPYEVGFIAIVVELVVQIGIGSLIKTFYFDVNYFYVVFCQMIVFFVNVPLSTFFSTLFLMLFSRYSNKVRSE